TVHLERLDGVGGARGVEPARREATDAELLVEAHRAAQDACRRRGGAHRLHGGRHHAGLGATWSSAWSRWSRSAAYPSSATSGSPPTRYAPGGIEPGARRARSTKAARTRRRTRLRVTAPPVRRPKAHARRGG